MPPRARAPCRSRHLRARAPPLLALHTTHAHNSMLLLLLLLLQQAGVQRPTSRSSAALAGRGGALQAREHGGDERGRGACARAGACACVCVSA